jgi:hypothetical protein
MDEEEVHILPLEHMGILCMHCMRACMGVCNTRVCSIVILSSCQKKIDGAGPFFYFYFYLCVPQLVARLAFSVFIPRISFRLRAFMTMTMIASYSSFLSAIRVVDP